MSEPLFARLSALLERPPVKATTLRSLDRMAGQHEGFLRQLLARRRPSADTETVLAYAVVFGADPAWLAWGRGRAPTDAQLRAALARARENPPPRHTPKPRRAAPPAEVSP